MRYGRDVWTKRMLATLAMLALAIVLGGCAGDDDEGGDPTATAETATQALPQNTPTAGTLSAANGNLITDSLCEALVPDGWVDDGTGRGSTSGGHAFVLFGGTVRSDADWDATDNLIATPSSGFAVASFERTDDSVHVVFANDRGFEFRKRFGNRYCDFRVTSRGPTISPDEQGFWDAVIQSLAPVQR